MLPTMKDQQRIEVVQALMDARLTVAEASQVLGRSERQVWRLLARAREDGLSGLLHGSRGREPASRRSARAARASTERGASAVPPPGCTCRSTPRRTTGSKGGGRT
jgi:transposase